jgi:ABC-type sulfate/molybdate transport systems ATPase subunit
LSLCLALLAAAGKKGIHLPLVLDEPFARLDARSTAALAAVLEDFCRLGHQVIVVTGQPAAAERLASVGATFHDMASLQHRVESIPVPSSIEPRQMPATSNAVRAKKRKRPKPTAQRQSAAERHAPHRDDQPSDRDQSDAA